MRISPALAALLLAASAGAAGTDALLPMDGSWAGNVSCRSGRAKASMDITVGPRSARIRYVLTPEATKLREKPPGFAASVSLSPTDKPGEFASYSQSGRSRPATVTVDGHRMSLRKPKLPSAALGDTFAEDTLTGLLTFDARWRSVSIQLRQGSMRRSDNCTGALKRTEPSGPVRTATEE